MMPEPPTLSFEADDYQRLAATAQQIETSMAAIQQALDGLGSTKATEVVRKCLALDFAEPTAERHVANILSKLGLHSRAQIGTLLERGRVDQAR